MCHVAEVFTFYYLDERKKKIILCCKGEKNVLKIKRMKCYPSFFLSDFPHVKDRFCDVCGTNLSVKIIFISLTLFYIQGSVCN